MALKGGAGQSEITPPIGVEMCGYGYYLQRRATEVLDPLRARALVLDSGGVRVAIVACDLIGLTEATVAEARRLIQRQTGIPSAHVLFACSHTHSGPTTIEVRGCGGPEREYMALLPHYLASAVAQATGNLRPVAIGFAAGEVKGLAMNRVEGEDGPLDEGLPVMRIQGLDGLAVATVYCVSAHGVTHLSSNTTLSADWIGLASARIQVARDGLGLFLQGSCGDINPVLVHTGKCDEAGALVANHVTDLTSELDYCEEVDIEAATRRLALPLDVTPVENLEHTAAEARKTLRELPPGPETFAGRATARFELEWAAEALAMHLRGLRRELLTEIQAIRIGDGLLLAHGGELFCEFGLELKARFAPRPTFVVGYANGFIGYVPDPEDFERGGYAAATVPKMCGNFPFTSDVGSRLVGALSELAAEVGA